MKMNSLTKIFPKVLASMLFSAMLSASPWAIAAGESSAEPLVKSEHARCPANNPNCRAGTRESDSEVARAFISHARLNMCPEGAPECAARAKFERHKADDAVRDRHACRD
jgi:hypothetical protein